MAKTLEEGYLLAEKLLESFTHCPPALEQQLKPNANNKDMITLDQRLQHVYNEEVQKKQENVNLISSVHLLDKLVAREKLTCLVVNLYPEDEGYSLMLRGKEDTYTETMKLPYEESEFLEYVDNEEIPPILLDLLEKAQVNLFYQGNVLCEIRDFRQSTIGTGQTYAVRHVLLKPTAQSLTSDINALMTDGHRWTMDEKIHLESRLLLATQSPLCLDPSPAVACLSDRIHQSRTRLFTRSVKRCLKRNSQAVKNRRAMAKTFPAPPGLQLIDFLAKKKERSAPPPVNLKVGKACVDMWKQRDLNLPAPENINVEQYSTVLDRPRWNDSSVVPVEEVILETDHVSGKTQHVRVTIQQRQLDQMYQGELYIDRDYNPREGRKPGGTTKFYLGSLQNAQRYLKQLTDTLSTETQRPVKISRIMPGQPPQLIQNPTAHSHTNAKVKTEVKAPSLKPGVSGTDQSKSNNSGRGHVGPGGDASQSIEKPLKLTLPLSASAKSLHEARLREAALSQVLPSPLTVSQVDRTQVSSIVSSVPIFTTSQSGALRLAGRQPPAYLDITRATAAQLDANAIASPGTLETQGSMPTTPTVVSSVPIVNTSLSLSHHQIRKSPVVQTLSNQSIPAPPYPTARRLSVPNTIQTQGSMGPPPTPPSSTLTATPSPVPTIQASDLAQLSGLQVLTESGETQDLMSPGSSGDAQTISFNISMPGVGNVTVPISIGAGVLQSGVINTPIGVVTSLPNLVQHHPTMVSVQRSSADASSLSSAQSNTNSSTQNLLSTQGILAGAINIVGCTQSLVGAAGGSTPIIASSSVNAGTNVTSNSSSQARLTQIMANLKNVTAAKANSSQTQVPLLPQQQQPAVLYNASITRSLTAAQLQQLQQQLQQHLQQQQLQQQQLRQQQLQQQQTSQEQIVQVSDTPIRAHEINTEKGTSVEQPVLNLSTNTSTASMISQLSSIQGLQGNLQASISSLTLSQQQAIRQQQLQAQLVYQKQLLRQQQALKGKIKKK